jgi:hypothetical protein
MLIFDCPDFQVVSRYGGSGPHLLTFSSLGMFTGENAHADGKKFWGKALADKLNLSATGFVAKTRNWFCSPEMWRATSEVSKRLKDVGNVVAYGSSMGAYAALRWGKHSGATSVIAFAPQYSIEPSLVSSFDRRYEVWFRSEMHRGMGVKKSDIQTPSYVFVDPNCSEDAGHIRLLQTVSPSICVIPLYNCGHECVRVFARTELAEALLRASLLQTSRTVRDLSSAARSKAPIRHVELAMRLAENKPCLARRVYERHTNSFESSQRRTFLATLDSSIKIKVAMLPQQNPPKVPSPTRLAYKSQVRAIELHIPEGASDNVEKNISRIVHLHVPKTAGTALRSAFEKQFQGKLRVFPHWDEAQYSNVNPDDFDFFSGHIGFETAKRLGGKLITVLRHPVDRFVSVYYFWRQLYERGIERSFNTELASKYSLNEFVKIRDQPGLLEEFYNRSALQIAHGSALHHRRELRQRGLTEDEIFRMAVGNLREFAVVGIQEDMLGLASKIRNATGIELGVQRINVTEARSPVSEIDIGTRNLMHQWLYMDLELYAEVIRQD